MARTPLEVDVRGTSSITRLPERAVLSINVASEGPSQEVVSQEVSSTCNELKQSFITLASKTATGEAAPEAAITTFSTSSLRSWSNVPVDYNTKQTLPRVYNASSGFEVIFRNFEVLGNVASKLFLMPHVTVNSIGWRLTEMSLQALGAESRKQAMSDAISKANDFASFLGREIVAVKVNDEGVNTREMTTQSHVPHKKASGIPLSVSESDDISLAPEKVVVTASARVKFLSVD